MTAVPAITNHMAIEINQQTDLTDNQINALLQLIDTPQKRCEVLQSLYVIASNLEKFCVYRDSPLRGQPDNPIYKLLLTANNIIGCLLKPSDKVLPRPFNGGEIVEVIPQSNNVNYGIIEIC